MLYCIDLLLWPLIKTNVPLRFQKDTHIIKKTVNDQILAFQINSEWFDIWKKIFVVKETVHIVVVSNWHLNILFIKAAYITLMFYILFKIKNCQKVSPVVRPCYLGCRSLERCRTHLTVSHNYRQLHIHKRSHYFQIILK